MLAKPRIALVAAADHTREAVARYLRDAGFDVHECEELSVPRGFGAVVVIDAQSSTSETLVATMRRWVKVAKTQQLVVVTAKPTALRDLVATHGERLSVLPAPAFGWDVVDALRATRPPRPRGA